MTVIYQFIVMTIKSHQASDYDLYNLYQIKPAVMYAVEIVNKDDEKLKLQLIKIVKKICGLTKINEEQYRSLKKSKIKNIGKYVKLR